MKQLDKWQWSTLILSAILVMAFSVFIYRYEPFKSGFEITDQLGGNIFPATILSTATTDAQFNRTCRFRLYRKSQVVYRHPAEEQLCQ